MQYFDGPFYDFILTRHRYPNGQKASVYLRTITISSTKGQWSKWGAIQTLIKQKKRKAKQTPNNQESDGLKYVASRANA
jgi:hypothetical protein